MCMFLKPQIPCTSLGIDVLVLKSKPKLWQFGGADQPKPTLTLDFGFSGVPHALAFLSYNTLWR